MSWLTDQLKQQGTPLTGAPGDQAPTLFTPPAAPAAPAAGGLTAFVQGLQNDSRQRSDMVLTNLLSSTSPVDRASATRAAELSGRAAEVLGKPLPETDFMTDPGAREVLEDAFLQHDLRRRVGQASNSTALWASESPVNASLFEQFGEDVGLMDGFINGLARGLAPFKPGAYGLPDYAVSNNAIRRLEAVEKTLGLPDRKETSSEKMPELPDTVLPYLRRKTAPERYTTMQPEAVEALRGISQAVLETTEAKMGRDAAKLRENYPQMRKVRETAAEYERRTEGLQGAELWREFADFVWDNPGGVTAMAVEASAESLPSMAAGALTTLATGNPALGAGVATSANYARMETAARTDVAEDMGYDLTKQEDLERLLRDPAARSIWNDRTQAYAVTVAAVDVLSLGVAGKQLAKTPLGDLVLQGLTQAAMGSGGEVLGRLAADLEIDPLEVALEGLAELVTTPVEVIGIAGRRFGQARAQRKSADFTRRFFDALAGISDMSEFKKQAPAKFAELTDRLMKNGPVETVNIDNAAVKDLFQTGQTTPEQFVQAFPSLTLEKLMAQIDSGQDITVKTAEYASTAVGMSFEPQLRQHIRIGDGLTPFDAAAQAEPEAQAEMQAEIERMRRNMNAVEDTQQEIFESVQQDILDNTGAAPLVAREQAYQLTAFAATQARRAGMSIKDFTEKYPLPSFRDQDFAESQNALNQVLRLLRRETPVTQIDLEGELGPDFFGRPGWATLTSDLDQPAGSEMRPEYWAEQQERKRAALEERLKAEGVPYRKLTGYYGGPPENSFLVLMGQDAAQRLGRELQQDSVLTREGFVYTMVSQPNTLPTGRLLTGDDAERQGFYSVTEDGQRFSLGMDFDNTGPGAMTLPDGYTQADQKPGLPVNPDGKVELFHYSPQEGLTELDPARKGTGPMRNADAYQGTYYGIAPRTNRRAQGGGYVRESASLGDNMYMALVDPIELYDYVGDPEGLVDARNTKTTQDRIVAAGYTGFYMQPGATLLGQTAVMFEARPVEAVDAAEVLERYQSPYDRTQTDATDERGRERQAGGGEAPLPGAPVVKGASGPDANLVAAAEDYARRAGIDLQRQAYFAEVDPTFATRIAEAYEAMEHTPTDPEVVAAYEDLIEQTLAQYGALLDHGYSFTFFDNETDPYGGNPWNAMRDLRANKTMAVYGTYAGYGTEGITDGIDDNPLLEDTGLQWPDQNGVMQPVTANDLFRAVHDAFGHGIEGSGFRARGEENAWQAHARLFTGKALGALTTETRGQNSWLNYGPHGEKNRTAGIEDTIFAEQKVNLLPEWAWTENVVPPESDVAPDNEGPTNVLFQSARDTSGKTGLPLLNRLSEAQPLAKNDRFKTMRDFKLMLQARVEAFEADSGIDMLDRGDQTVKDLVEDYVVEDALTALAAGVNAVGWYDTKVTGAKKQMARIYPEILTNRESELAFIWALAVTSNGLEVNKNFELAAKAYEHWREHKTFPPNIGTGQAKKAINNGLLLHGILKERFGSPEALAEFMTSEGAVRDLQKQAGMEISGEHQGTVVRGAAVLGPKIGNGFFSNLYGLFDALTLDRWMMRTVGRWRGRLIEARPELAKQKRKAVRALLKEMTKEQRAEIADLVGSKITLGLKNDEIDALAARIDRKGGNVAWRAKLSSAADGAGDRLRLLGNGLAKDLDGQQEAPRDPTDRNFLREVFGKALTRLQEEHDLGDLTMADLQALLWYPEKLLYDSSKKPAGKEVLNYDENAAPDYENAARALVERKLAERSRAGRAGSGDREDASRSLFQEAAPVESDAFKRWFGDSKVVDENGDPLVVFHGTERGGFDVFDTDGAGKTANTGAFFTDSRFMASTYFSGMRGQTVTPPTVEGVMADPESYDFDIEQEEDGWGAYDPQGNYYPAETREEAVEDAVLSWRDNANRGGGDLSGAYEVYLSLQDPLEIDAEGANWQSIGGEEFFVENEDGEVVEYATDEEAAEDFVSANEEELGPLTIKRETGGENGMSTDDIARMARDAGADGVIIRNVFDGGPHGQGGETGTVYVVFAPTQVKSVNNRGTFEPDNPSILEQKRRGRLILPPSESPNNRPIIEVWADADLSTVLHESAHYFLYTTEQMIANGDASPDMIEDMNTLRNWWTQNAEQVAAEGGASLEDVQTYLANGTTGNEATDWQVYVGMQEMFARSYERYLMEGKAPTKGLQRFFETVRAWMTTVYASVRELSVPLNDEVREVFDRMIAADEELTAARSASPEPDMVSSAPDVLGVSDEEWAELQKLSAEAQEEAKTELLREILAPVKAARRAEVAEARARITEEVTQDVESQPVYRITEWLGNNRWVSTDEAPEAPDADPQKFRLDREIFIEEYGIERLRQLPRGARAIYSDTTAISADELAEWFGYASGDEMVDALVAAPPKRATIDQRVKDRMAQELGPDPLRDGTAAADARDAIHTDARGRLIEKELRALGKRATKKNPRTPLSEIREIAREQIRNATVREAIRTGTYRQAAERAGERAQRALARGNFDEAYEAKRQQLLQHALFMEAKRAEELTDKTVALAKRLRSKTTRQGIENTYLDAIDELLARYDFRQGVSRREEARRGAVQAYVQMMQETGRAHQLAIPQDVLDTAERRPYRSLTVDELKGVSDALTNIMHTGRFKQDLLDKKAARELEAVADELVAKGEENVKRKSIPRTGLTGLDRWVASGKEVLDIVLNADTLLRRFDGWSYDVWYRAIKQPIDEAETEARKMREAAAQRMEEIYGVYSQSERRKMAKKENHPTLRVPRDRAAQYNKWELISIALNLGNRDNVARLMEKDTGYGFTKQQIQYVKQQLDDRDWDFVQSVWDHVNSYWAETEAREKRQTGVAPEKVQPIAVETPSGRVLPGGYYPIAYAQDIGTKASADELKDTLDAMRAGQYGKAATRNGHTKERAKGSGGRVMALDVAVYHRHIAQVIQDLAFSEVVNNSWRVLQHEKVDDFLTDTRSAADKAALEMWLQDTAVGTLVAGGVIGKTAMRLKNTFTMSKLGLNLSTVLIQPTGLVQSAVVIGKVPMARGMVSYYGRPARWIEKVGEASPFMQERRQTFHRDIYDMMGDTSFTPLAGRYKRFQQVAAQVGFWMMTYMQYYVVDMPTWVAAYKQKVRETQNEEEARTYADRMVARSQASGVMADRTAIERGTVSRDTRMNGFIRLFTALGSYMFAKGNVAHERVLRGRSEVTGMNLQSATAIFSTLLDLVLLFTVEAVLYHLVKGTLPGLGEDDDDDQGMAAFLAVETGLSIMGTMPFVRDLAGPVKGFDGGGTYGAIGSELMAPMVQAAEGEADKAFKKALVSAIGTTTGFPSGQVNRGLDAYWRQREGEDVAPIEYIMGRR